MAGGRIDPAFRDELDNRRDQHFAVFARDRVCSGTKHDVVLARDYVRAVLFKPAGCDDYGIESISESSGNLTGGHFFDENRVDAADSLVPYRLWLLRHCRDLFTQANEHEEYQYTKTCFCFH